MTGKKINIGILISGTGSNMDAICDACDSGKIPGKVVFVGSDNPGAAGLKKASKRGIPTFVVPYADIIKRFRTDPGSIDLPPGFDLKEAESKQKFFKAGTDPDKIKNFLASRAACEAMLLEKMEEYDFDLLVLAGFMRNLTPFFIDRINTDPDFPRIMNIHPALLPAFPGTDGYGDTYRYGCKVAGCTVHFIDYGEDSGPIIGQRAFEITAKDTLETIKAKGLSLEWELYPECIAAFARNRLKCVTKTYTLPGGKVYQRRVVIWADKD